MSIAISADSPTLARPPAAGVMPVSAGAALQAGASDDSEAAGQPFDAALQACLIDPASPAFVAADVPPAGAGQEADPAAASSSEDDGQPASLQGVPPLLMAWMPSGVPVVPQAATSAATPAAAAMFTDARSEPSVVAAGSVSTSPRIAVTTVPVGEARPMSLPAAVVADGGASLVSAVALAVETSGQRPRSPSPSAGAGLTPAALGMSAVDTPEAGHGGAVDRGDQLPLVAAQSIGTADAGAARSPDAPLRLPNGDTNQWRQPLMQALGERLQFASERGIDSAVIRLEPPRMGSIEIAIRHQDGALQVNLSATHNEVLRQLQDISDSLRHGLGQRHAGDVTVQIAEASASRAGQGDGERQRQRQAQSEQNPGRALGDAEADGGAQSFRLARNEE